MTPPTLRQAHQDAYFFHDVSTYSKVIKEEIPNIDDITLLYLKEAMQAFQVGCILSSSVMLGVAAEHIFLLMLEEVENNHKWSPVYNSVGKQRTILQKINKFRNILDQNLKEIPSEI